MISVCFEVFSCRITKERKYGAIIFRGTSECVGADEAGRTAVTADSTETAERWRTNLEVQMRENVSTGSSFHRVILQTEPEIHPVSLFNSGSAPTLDICPRHRPATASSSIRVGGPRSLCVWKVPKVQAEKIMLCPGQYLHPKKRTKPCRSGRFARGL